MAIGGLLGYRKASDTSVWVDLSFLVFSTVSHSLPGKDLRVPVS